MTTHPDSQVLQKIFEDVSLFFSGAIKKMDVSCRKLSSIAKSLILQKILVL
jgi:hypothetical protein